jgi:hypothetical protein
VKGTTRQPKVNHGEQVQGQENSPPLNNWKQTRHPSIPWTLHTVGKETLLNRFRHWSENPKLPWGKSLEPRVQWQSPIYWKQKDTRNLKICLPVLLSLTWVHYTHVRGCRK